MDTSVSMQKLGPRKGPDGKMLARSLLGDPSDFEAMSREQTRVRSTTPRNIETGSQGADDQRVKEQTNVSALGASTVSKADTLMNSLQEGLDREMELRTALSVLNQTKTKARDERCS